MRRRGTGGCYSREHYLRGREHLQRGAEGRGTTRKEDKTLAKWTSHRLLAHGLAGKSRRTHRKIARASRRSTSARPLEVLARGQQEA